MYQVDFEIVTLWSELCVQLTNVAQLLGNSTPESVILKTDRSSDNQPVQAA